MEDLHAGHATRIERLAAVAAGHAKRNAALERTQAVGATRADPEDLQVLYGQAPESIVEGVTQAEVAAMRTRKVINPRKPR